MTRGSIKSCVVLVSLAYAVLSAQQPRDGRAPAAGTASISGVVLTADTLAAPVRRATVEIAGSAMLTDDDGRFSFGKLPAGSFNVIATKAGFLPAAFGARRAAGAGTPIDLSNGQQVTGIQLRLVGGSVLAGVVTDQGSRALADTEVRAYRFAFDADTGLRMPMPVTTGLGVTTTDDKGRYRLYGLEPGEYVVSAGGSPAEGAMRAVTDDDIRYAQQMLRLPPGTAPDGSLRRPAPVISKPRANGAPLFFPSAESIQEASRITLGIAEERQGVDVVRRVVANSVIKGNVSGSWAAVRDGGKIHVIDVASSFMVSTPWDKAYGSFAFGGIPPGRYQILAMSENGGLVARAEAFVAPGSETALGLVLQPGATVNGRVVFERTTAQDADPTLVRLSLAGASRAVLPYRTSPLAADGKFTWMNVPIGAYRLGVTTAANLQPGWRVKSARIGEIELLDGVFDVSTMNAGEMVITLSDARSEISGTMQSADGAAISDYSVLVFSADRQFWRPMSRRTAIVRPASNGRYVVRDLPEGDYLIVALNDVEAGQWHNPEFLADLAPFGLKVTLGDGEKKKQDIRVGGGL